MNEVIIKEKAIKMFFQRKKKSTIRKTLKVNNEQLNNWIKDTFKDKKKTAIYMYFTGWSKIIICNQLDIKLSLLNTWINSKYIITKDNVFKRTTVSVKI